MTQEERVFRHLKDHGSITSIEAFKNYGITRLSAKIYTLKKQGHNITGEYETCMNRYGEKVKFKKYRMEAARYATE